MKTIYHLAISRLKYNKGRSILTIVAIALMTTLLMSIGTWIPRNRILVQNGYSFRFYLWGYILALAGCYLCYRGCFAYSWGFYPKTVKNGVRDFSCGSNAVSRTDRKTKKEKIL